MAEQQRKTFQFGPDVVPVILFKGQFRAGQKRHRLAQLFAAQSGEGVAEQLTAVLPDPMFIKPVSYTHLDVYKRQAVEY